MATRIKTDPTKYTTFFPIILDSVEYIFHIYWNDSLAKRGFSDSGWYLSIYNPSLFDLQDLTADQSPALLRGGIKIMPNALLLEEEDESTGLPSGYLGCMDNTPEKGAKEDFKVTLDNFGTGKRFELVYFTKQEGLELLGG